MQQAQTTSAPRPAFSPNRIAYYTDHLGQKHLVSIAPDGADKKIPELASWVSKEDKHSTARELASRGKLRCPENGCKLAVVGVQDWEHQFRHEMDQQTDCILNQKELSARATWQIIAKHSLASWAAEAMQKQSRDRFTLAVEGQRALESQKDSLQKAPDVLVRVDGTPVFAIECQFGVPADPTYISAKTELYRQNGVEVMWVFEPKSFLSLVSEEKFEFSPASEQTREETWATNERFYFFDSNKAELLVPYTRSRIFEDQEVDPTEKWPEPISRSEVGKPLAEEPARRYPWRGQNFFGIDTFALDDVQLIYLRRAETRFLVYSPIDAEWSKHLAGYEEAQKVAVRNRTMELGDPTELGFSKIHNLVDELFADAGKSLRNK